jgi:hypothetical protein
MPKMGFRADGSENAYVYLESADGGSACVGFASSDNNRLHISPSLTTGESPSTGSPMLVLDPRTGGTLGEGDIVLLPRGHLGSGSVVIQSGTISQPGANAGVLMVDTSAQGYYGSSNGTNGQILIGGGTIPAWANLTSTGGSVTITNGANTINLEVAGGATSIETITGNTGGARPPTAGNINIVTANATPVFAGAASTETLDFNLTNLALGSSMGAVTTGAQNVGLGAAALAAITSAEECTAVGYRALVANTQGFQNTAVGDQSLVTLNNTSNSNGFNTSIGSGAGFRLVNGSYNAFLGAAAGNAYTTTESSNICVNNNGTVGESNTLRIGKATGSANQELAAAYICGIDGVNVGSVAKVLTMASDQLGTATITAGANVSVSTSANTITIAASGAAGFAWTEVSGTSQSASVDQGYIASNAGVVTITLPAIAAVGDFVRIAGKGAGGWSVAQNLLQVIHFDGVDTTVGVGGSLSSSNRYDAVELLCITANTDWVVLSSVGNLTVV